MTPRTRLLTGTAILAIVQLAPTVIVAIAVGAWTAHTAWQTSLVRARTPAA